MKRWLPMPLLILLIIMVGCAPKRKVTTLEAKEVVARQETDSVHDHQTVEVTWWGAPPPLAMKDLTPPEGVVQDAIEVIRTPTDQPSPSFTPSSTPTMGGIRVERVRRHEATLQHTTSEERGTQSEHSNEPTTKSSVESIASLLKWLVALAALVVLMRLINIRVTNNK